MYFSRFGFSQPPFGLTPNTELFHGLAPHYEAIHTVMSAVTMGEGVIKLTGEVGTGKTMVCRMLIEQLEHDYSLVYLPNPVLDGDGIRFAIANELQVDTSDSRAVVDNVQRKLVELREAGKPVVALIDEAQALSDEALETIRLFGNLETINSKLLQIVLIGQPELEERLAQHHLRQFRQRITFSAQLRPLTLAEASAYIDHRITSCGGSKDLFNLSQKKSIWRAASGIPRIINQLCHKALLLAFTSDKQTVANRHLFDAMKDTYVMQKPKYKTPCLWGWQQV
ncbi:ExeA family protein [Vibrio breoganii]|uniref:ExeA family protein n=1 Tax=Vibrio breoganii TaxID=553239 RepID=UPI000C85AEB1|nr:AAA family ATPase [Vibrio breoganii]PMK43085.1 MSHA biogenesis protein MshM [Vibrio breoganii]